MRKRLAKEKLGPQQWIDAARKLLLEEGIAAVQIGALARRLNATTGSFYWHFRGRAALHEDVLALWETTNTQPYYDALANGAGDPGKQIRNIAEMWVDEEKYDSAFDSAIRDWARTSPAVANAVRRVDNLRIELLRKIFLGFGYDARRSLIRARVMYFHQVGYYALAMQEAKARRRSLMPLYLEVLAGPPLPVRR